MKKKSLIWDTTLRRFLVSILLLLLYALCSVRVMAQPTAIKAEQVTPGLYESGKLIIKLRSNSAEESPQDVLKLMNAEARELGITRVDQILKQLAKRKGKSSKTYVVYFTKNIAADEASKILEKNPNIEFVEKVPSYQLFHTPNDLHANQWHLGKINAQAAWDISTGNSGVVVAVIDNWCNIDHNDLVNAVYTNPGEIAGDGIDNDLNGFIDDTKGWDFSGNDNNVRPQNTCYGNDIFSHGTHVAGIIAATSNNGSGTIASIGYSVRFMPLQVCDDNQPCSPVVDFLAVLDATEYAIMENADVINMSFGGMLASATLEEVIREAHLAGIVVVAAAGNDGADIASKIEVPGCGMYPAMYPYVISVGATDASDAITGFSNYGDALDILAPGSQIYSTSAENNTDYLFMDGTSMASPVVAGLCALMISANPNQSPEQVELCLKQNADDVYPLNNSSYSRKLGSGRINAYKTMQCVTASPELAVTSNFQTVCPGRTVKFITRRLSGLPVTGYSWSFPGGSPSSSTSANPSILYATSGQYNVTLTVTYSGGSRIYTMNNYIKVAPNTTNYGELVDNNWYFGLNGTGVSFKNGTPEVVNDGNIHHYDDVRNYPASHSEGYATISNTNGQLLFYTNGEHIWNRHHELMLNGISIGGDFSSTQSVIIVPEPGECKNRYYVFTSKNGLKFTVVDMDGDNGLGAVDLNNKGVYVNCVHPSNAEKLAATLHCDGKNVWVLSHTGTANIFTSVLVEENFNPLTYNCTTTNIGTYYGSNSNNYVAGQMKFSPMGKRVAVTTYGVNTPSEKNEIFNFDKSTGVLSASGINAPQFGTGAYGCEFSPDDRYVYMGSLSSYSGFYYIYRRDLIGSNSTPLTLPSTITTTSFDLGPDGNIYFQNRGFGWFPTPGCLCSCTKYTHGDQRGYVGVIQNPNSASPTVDAKHLYLNGEVTGAGVANGFISKTLKAMRQYALSMPEKVFICSAGASITITSNYTGGGSVTYQWYSETSGILTGETNASLTTSTPGIYRLEVTLPDDCKIYGVTEVIEDIKTIDLGPDMCIQSGIVLDAGTGFSTYLWSTGATTQTIAPASAGTYSVTGTTANGCTVSDQINITAGAECCIKNATYNAFLKDYEVAENEFHQFIPVAKLQLATGGMVVAGTMRNEHGRSYYVMQTDNQGIIQWRRRYEPLEGTENVEALDIKEAADGGYVVAGNSTRSILFHIDANGNLLWKFNYDFGHSNLIAIEKTKNALGNIDGYLIMSSSDDHDAINVAKIDNTGGIVAQTTFQCPANIFQPAMNVGRENLQANLVHLESNYYVASLSIFRNWGAPNEDIENLFLKIADNSGSIVIATIKTLLPIADKAFIMRLLSTTDVSGNRQLAVAGATLARPFTAWGGQKTTKSFFMKLDANLNQVVVHKSYESNISINHPGEYPQKLLDVVEKTGFGTQDPKYVFVMSEGFDNSTSNFGNFMEYPVLFSTDNIGNSDNVISTAPWTLFTEYHEYDFNGNLLHKTPEGGYSLLCPEPNSTVYNGAFSLLKTSNTGFISNACSPDIEVYDHNRPIGTLGNISKININPLLYRYDRTMEEFEYRMQYGCCGPYAFTEPDPCVTFDANFDFTLSKNCTSESIQINFNSGVKLAKTTVGNQVWYNVDPLGNLTSVIVLPNPWPQTGIVSVCVEVTTIDGCIKKICKTLDFTPQESNHTFNVCTPSGQYIYMPSCGGSNYTYGGQTFVPNTIMHALSVGTHVFTWRDADGCIKCVETVTIQYQAPSAMLIQHNITVPCGTTIDLSQYQHCPQPMWTSSHGNWIDQNTQQSFAAGSNYLANSNTLLIREVFDPTTCISCEDQINITVTQTPPFHVYLCFMPGQESVTYDIYNMWGLHCGPIMPGTFYNVDYANMTMNMQSGGVFTFYNPSHVGTNTITYTNANGCPCTIVVHIAHEPCGIAPLSDAKQKVQDQQGQFEGVSGTNGLGKLKVYPNPSSGAFNFVYHIPGESSGFFELQIFDLSGRLVHQALKCETNRTHRVDLSKVSGSIYTAKIILNDKTEIVKLIKE